MVVLPPRSRSWILARQFQSRAGWPTQIAIDDGSRAVADLAEVL
jgi:hypothetical protein